MKLIHTISTVMLVWMSIFTSNPAVSQAKSIIQLKEPIQLLVEDSYIPLAEGTLLEVDKEGKLFYDEAHTYDLEERELQQVTTKEDITEITEIEKIPEEDIDPDIPVIEPIKSGDEKPDETEQQKEEDKTEGQKDADKQETKEEEKKEEDKMEEKTDEASPEENEDNNINDEDQKANNSPQEEAKEQDKQQEEKESEETEHDRGLDKEATEGEHPAEENEDLSAEKGKMTLQQTAMIDISETDRFTPNQENLSLMEKKATGELVKVSSLKQGEVYQYSQDVGNWLRIKIGSQIYYVWKNAVTPVEKSVPLHNPSSQAGSNQLTTIMAATVYDNSRNGLIAIGNIDADVTISYINRSGNWYQINYLGRNAFIYSSAVLEQNSNSKYITPRQADLTVNHPGKIPFATLEQGQNYEKLDEQPNWVRIKIGDNIGYVWKNAVWHTSESPGKTTASTGSATLETTEKVPVFDNSSGSLIKIGTIKEGEELNYIAKQGNWYQINFANRTGFIYHTGVKNKTFPPSARYFKTDQANVTINVRQNGSLKPYGKLEKGQTYQRLSDYGNWHRIRLGDQDGYIWKEATSPSSRSQIPNLTNAIAVRTIFTADQAVTVYDNSSGSLKAMGTINKGERIAALSVSGNWVKMNYSGREGYIYKPALSQVIRDIVNPKVNYTYEQMQQDIQQLTAMYPGHVESTIIGKSVDGRNIYAVKVGTGDKEIHINGAHHAREHLTTNVLMEMIDQYARAYATNSNYYSFNTRDILSDVSIWFVPMVNPDGVTLVQKGHRSVKNSSSVLRMNGNSTNFSSWKANARGVDLNRQYPADWRYIRNTASSPGPERYKGTAPLTEPEVRALYNFTNRHNFKTTASYHSSGEIIYWHYKNPSSTRYRDESIARQVGRITGYTPVAPTSNPSGGGYKDWFIQEHRMPGLTIEISPYTYGQPVPLRYWDKIWNENKTVGLYLAEEASRR